MKIILGILISVTLMIGCSKKPLTLDESTPMEALLRASDEQITELVVNEVAAEMGISAESISVDYILRDNDSQAMAVRLLHGLLEKRMIKLIGGGKKTRYIRKTL